MAEVFKGLKGIFHFIRIYERKENIDSSAKANIIYKSSAV